MTKSEALAAAHSQAARHWDAAADQAERHGLADLAEEYRGRADANWLLAQQP